MRRAAKRPGFSAPGYVPSSKAVQFYRVAQSAGAWFDRAKGSPENGGADKRQQTEEAEYGSVGIAVHQPAGDEREEHASETGTHACDAVDRGYHALREYVGWNGKQIGRAARVAHHRNRNESDGEPHILDEYRRDCRILGYYTNVELLEDPPLFFGAVQKLLVDYFAARHGIDCDFAELATFSSARECVIEGEEYGESFRADERASRRNPMHFMVLKPPEILGPHGLNSFELTWDVAIVSCFHAYDIDVIKRIDGV